MCGPYIQLLDDYRFYTCVLKHKPHEDIWICECLAQHLSLFQLYVKITALWQLSNWYQWYAFCWRGRHVITIAVCKTTSLVISNTYYNHINLRCTLCIDTGEQINIGKNCKLESSMQWFQRQLNSGQLLTWYLLLSLLVHYAVVSTTPSGVYSHGSWIVSHSSTIPYLSV